MPRIILIGEGDTVTLLSETGSPDTLLRSIHSGVWRPKLPDLNGPYQGIINGDTIIVTRRHNEPAKIDNLRITAQEKHVLEGMINGLGDQQIALVYGIKVRMVRHFVANLRLKFKSATREQLVAQAVALGLVNVHMN
jgi:DNA-binding CsgD family transcriptional regulator